MLCSSTFHIRRFLSSSRLHNLDNILADLSSRTSHDELSVVSKQVVESYSDDDDKKVTVLRDLAKHCGVRHNILQNAISLYSKNQQTAHEVYIAACPAHYYLLRSIGNLSNGINIVCDMRARLLRLIKSESDKSVVSSLRRLEESSRDLLTTWFCLSNLKLNRLTWQSPGDILHKIAEYEAVHPVRGLVDFRKRLGTHRRCFYFSHEAMPREPLVMVHVALMDNISDNVQTIMNGTISDPSEDNLNTAIYYSITSTQKGLAGIDLGNLLIKQVAATIQSDVPSISVHSTLSPIPGFRAWLIRVLQGISDFDLVNDRFVSLVSSAMGKEMSREEAISTVLKVVSADGVSLSSLESFKDVLLYSCAKYLYEAKRNDLALNPVANFHLRNGAELFRLNWAGDTSGRGMANSLGLMVNYRYHLDRVHTNSLAYTQKKTICAHDNIMKLLQS